MATAVIFICHGTTERNSDWKARFISQENVGPSGMREEGAGRKVTVAPNPQAHAYSFDDRWGALPDDRMSPMPVCAYYKRQYERRRIHCDRHNRLATECRDVYEQISRYLNVNVSAIGMLRVILAPLKLTACN